MYELYILNELYDEWFSNRDYWFSKNSKIDVYLCDKYYKYIESTSYIYESYKKNPLFFDNKTIIAYIILLDQISRHFKRVYDTNIDIVEFSRKAVNFSNILLYNNKQDIFTIDELSFIYLPYRHLKDIDKIYEIISIYIELYEKANTEDKLKCRRYLQATLNNIYKDINLLSMKINKRVKSWEYINKDILDPRCLEDNKIVSVLSPIIHENMLNEIEKLKDGSTIIVSLSGGVDSMVALYLCKYIKDTYNPRKIKNIIAIHINYNNREHSGDELDFVNYYCNKLGVKLYFRTIKEISRNNCLHNGLRDLYEDITKNIRYDMYRLNIKNDSDRTYILLGHNKDDCFENVITNISNKSNYNNLCGMEVLKEIEGMMFWRPLLSIEKRHILDCANINKIPYLYDSTPAWSVRGKIRDTVRPSLLLLKNNEGIEDNSTIDSFFYLRDYIANTQDIFNELIIKNLISKIKYMDAENSRKYITEYSKTEMLSLKYIVIAKIFFSKLNIRYSHKAIKDFCEYIGTFDTLSKTQQGRKFILSKSCIIDIKINSKNNYNIIIT